MKDETQAVLDRVERLAAHIEKVHYTSVNPSSNTVADQNLAGYAADLAHLLATVDALREDARRMDFLEGTVERHEYGDPYNSYEPHFDSFVHFRWREETDDGEPVKVPLRAAIDAARATPTPEGR